MKIDYLTWEDSVLWLRNQPDRQELVRSCFFDDPLIDAAKRYYTSTEWQDVRLLLPNSCGKSLDMGAGRGISSYALARDNWDTTALEPDPSNIVGAGAIKKLAEEADLKINVVEEWGEKLPFPDETFDLVYGRQVLHHALDLQQFCREIGRVLKKNGMFIATREHVISNSSDLEQFLKNHPLHSLYGGENAYLLNQYVNAIQDSGIILTHILNPYQSNINLYPDTLEKLKIRLAKKIMFPFPMLIPDFILVLLGKLIKTPGRLYTFAGYKL